jgi:hypothetical protein
MMLMKLVVVVEVSYEVIAAYVHVFLVPLQSQTLETVMDDVLLDFGAPNVMDLF